MVTWRGNLVREIFISDSFDQFFVRFIIQYDALPIYRLGRVTDKR